MKIRVALLGATGSIGASALELVREFGSRLELVSLSARANEEALLRAAEEFRVRKIALADPAAAGRARRRFQGEVLEGENGVTALARDPDADVILNALVGSAGLAPSVAALEAKKRLALANKESIVVAGELLLAMAKERGGTIVPVDSEHSALHQLLEGRTPDSIRRLVLTASGGPFLRRDPATLHRATPEEVLRHPTWSMGERITVDSATLVNKGFEIIEARWLFGVPPERIDVMIHPQSVVHGLVEFVDGSTVAQLSRPDMRLPLLYALSYPERWASKLPRLDVALLQGLQFEAPDPARSPGLALARKALAMGGTAAAVLNAADEEAVRLFLKGAIGFDDLTRITDEVLGEHQPGPAQALDPILAADRWARSRVADLAAARSRR